MLQIEILSLVLLTLCAIAVYLFFRQTEKDKLLAKIGGPKPLPLFGNSLYLIGPKEEAFPKILAWCHKHGQRFISRVGGTCFFNTCSAEDMEIILGSQIHIEKGHNYSYLSPWLGTGLLVSRGQRWFSRRKLLTPAFHFKILEDFVSLFSEHSAILVEILKSKFSDGNFKDISPYIARCTLDILCETAMGKRINAQLETDTEYIKAVSRMGKLVQLRTVTPWLQPEFIWKRTSLGKEHDKMLNILHTFTEEVIQERKAQFHAKSKIEQPPDEEDAFVSKRKLAFLDLLIEAQASGVPDLTDLDIRDEADTFMFEGHDTTTAATNFGLYLLGCNPDKQALAFEEIDEIFGDDRERPITSADLHRMKYLECCLKESLRIYPSAPFIERILRTDLVLGDGTIVPAGVTAFMIIYQMHRDPTYFPEPEKYKPERFFLENQTAARRNPFSYVPFSAGPRNCIGQKFAMMELKIVVANILRNFTVISEVPPDKLKLLAELTVRPLNGIKVKLIPRIFS